MSIMDYNKVEDSVLKRAMEIFQQSAVSFFNIGTKIIAPAETEIKNIEIKDRIYRLSILYRRWFISSF